MCLYLLWAKHGRTRSFKHLQNASTVEILLGLKYQLGIIEQAGFT